MKVHELIEILKTHDSRAEVELESSEFARKSSPLTYVEKWGFLGHNTVILRCTKGKTQIGKHGDIVDAEPVTPKLENGGGSSE